MGSINNGPRLAAFQNDVAHQHRRWGDPVILIVGKLRAASAGGSRPQLATRPSAERRGRPVLPDYQVACWAKRR